MVFGPAQRLKSVLLTLVLAVSFAMGPVASQFLMAHSDQLAALSGHAAAHAPCPLHGDAMPQSAGGSDEGAPPHGFAGTCYCGLVCNAVVALPLSFDLALPSGGSVQTERRPFASHAFEPALMPRPPKR